MAVAVVVESSVVAAAWNQYHICSDLSYDPIEAQKSNPFFWVLLDAALPSVLQQQHFELFKEFKKSDHGKI